MQQKLKLWSVIYKQFMYIVLITDKIVNKATMLSSRLRLCDKTLFCKHSITHSSLSTT